jgi:hypothetical protein
MSEALRVRTPDTAQVATYNGTQYPVKDGVALIPDDGQLRQQKSDVLPAVSVSLSHLDLPELRCIDCGRKKLAMFGQTCGHCGGRCAPVVEVPRG